MTFLDITEKNSNSFKYLTKSANYIII